MREKVKKNLTVGLLKKRKKRSELEEKQRKYVRSFAPQHYSWQKNIGKNKKKRPKKVSKEGKF